MNLQNQQSASGPWQRDWSKDPNMREERGVGTGWPVPLSWVAHKHTGTQGHVTESSGGKTPAFQSFQESFCVLISIHKTKIRGWEIAQWLRTLATLLEDPSSIPSTHMVAHNHCLQLQFQEIWCPFLTSAGTRFTCGAQATHTHTHLQPSSYYRIIQHKSSVRCQNYVFGVRHQIIFFHYKLPVSKYSKIYSKINHESMPLS